MTARLAALWSSWAGRLRPSCQAAADGLLGLLYPNRCQICGEEEAMARQGYVGLRCQRTVRPIRPPFCSRCGLPFPPGITQEFTCANCADLHLAFESARAAVVASGVTLEVVHRFKYGRALWFEPFLTDLLLTAAVPSLEGGGWTDVVPVPLYPARERHREFNQAERLGRPLAAALGLRLQPRLIRRVAPTLTQTHLSRTERSRNVVRAFRPAGRQRIRGASVIVVDDVLTTGATASAVARVLRRMGAARVCVWSVARAIRNEPPLA